jgi:DNA topoisomerase III
LGKALYITEKPSVAASFASVLGVSVSRTDRSRGFAESQQSIVTWCFGHLVTMAYPDAYNPEWKQWRIQHLPILPAEWIYQTIQEKGNHRQYEVIATLLHRADVDVVYACTDSGREGEYIFRLVYAQSGSQKPARRVWISAQTEEAVKKGIQEARELAAYDNLGKAAYCRAKEDWLFGMNFSRLFTCQYGRDLARHLEEPKSAVVAIGRVMTCVLGLVVDRELEIRHFVSKTNYAVVASFVSRQAGIAYKGRWQPATKGKEKAKGKGTSADAAASQERPDSDAEETDALTREDAQALIDRLSGKPAEVRKVEVKTKPEPPPLLFNLAELQSEANRRFKMPVDRVLEVAQTLYEKKHISYPRTDSRVLSTEVVPELPKVLNGLFGQTAWKDAVLRIKDFGKLSVNAGSKRFVDDAKVTDHYAIIPTYQAADPDALEGDAGKIYTLIVKRFLAIFYPPAEYSTVKVETVVDGECFTTSSKTLKNPGWKEVYDATAGKAEDDLSESPIHKLVKKEPCDVTGYELEERQTKPPSRFTDGTLVLTMEKAGKYIENEELRAQIRTSGIGTSATRSGIIKKLADVGYMRIQPKTQVISPTEKGEAIVALVRLTARELLSPALTASWEKGLNQVQTGDTQEQEFIDKLEAYIARIIGKVKRQGPVTIGQALARLNLRSPD